MTQLKISDIKIDESLYPRNGYSEYNVIRLINALEAGATFPPIIVESRTHRLVDGRHRLEVYKRKGIKNVVVQEKKYLSDADLFADAVRLNVTHGEVLDSYSIKNAVLKLSRFGYSLSKISEVVHLPAVKVQSITKGFATSPKGEPMAIKGGLKHLAGDRLTNKQVAINQNYAGMNATFYAKQIIDLLESDMWPKHLPQFRDSMEKLCDLWEDARKEKLTKKKVSA